jgi:hypothetical protein
MKSVLLMLLCALALHGCGPGLTGTGTGSAMGLAAFNATEQAVCGAPFAAAIGCSTAAGAPTPLGGVSYFESGTGASLVRLRLEGNTIEITAPCAGFSFEGVWGRSAALGDRFYGAQELNGGATLLPATASAVAVGTDLQLTVQDAQARNLLTPVTVQRQMSAPAAAVCP